MIIIRKLTHKCKRRPELSNHDTIDCDISQFGRLKLKTKTHGNRERSTNIHLACKTGKVKRMLEELAEGADVNAVDGGGFTPIMDAINSGLTMLHRSPDVDSVFPIQAALIEPTTA